MNGIRKSMSEKSEWITEENQRRREKNGREWMKE